MLIKSTAKGLKVTGIIIFCILGVGVIFVFADRNLSGIEFEGDKNTINFR